jgi:hypothetical protein
MKNQVLITVILFALVGFNTVSKAQIVITPADATVINAVGHVITNHFDSTTTSVNIGVPGSTSWDFSALNSHISNSFTSVIPSSTPYYSTDYPTSNVVFAFSQIIENDTADAWQYSTQNPGEYLMNGVTVLSIIDADEFLEKNIFLLFSLFFHFLLPIIVSGAVVLPLPIQFILTVLRL